MGNRLNHLQFAINELCRHGEIENVHVSSIYETDPVGGPEQEKFLNAVVIAETTLSAHDTLALAHHIEAEAHRVREVHWGPRTLDIDVLAYGNEMISDDVITVPHPRATERGFVLIPWAEIDPDFVLPTGKSVQQYAAEVSPAGVEHNPNYSVVVHNED